MRIYLVTVCLYAIFVLSGCQNLVTKDLNKLPPTAALSEESVPGEVNIRYYDDIPGKQLSDLEASPKFPDHPDSVVAVNTLEQSGSRGDNYGSYVRGFIRPLVSGGYSFMLSGDDQTELWLSSSMSPTQKKLIASVPGSSPRRGYDSYSSQRSGIIQLDADTKYYFEIKHKEGTGGDHFSVAWKGPGIPQQIVGADYLLSYSVPLYPEDEQSIQGFRLGYRIGYFDGVRKLKPSGNYPPLDMDEDGLYDNWEVEYGLSPSNHDDANSDSDSDLLSATDEFWLMTKENNPDTDDDGIPDGFEYAFGLDPLDSTDGEMDYDLDGFTNLEEYNAGTDPTDSSSFPGPTSKTLPGLYAHYFTGKEFDSLAGTRADKSIDYRWGYGAPIPELPVDGFSARWIGFFQAPHSSGSHSYRFEATSDDGIRLFLGGKELLNGWWNHGVATFTGTATLEASERLPITVEYYENRGGAVAQLKIIDTSTGKALKPEEVLSYPDPDAVTSEDTDADAVPDWWEVRMGTNPWQDDAAVVLSASGVSVLEAYKTKVSPWTLEPIRDISYDSGGNGGLVTPPPAESQERTITATWTAPLTRTNGEALSLSEIDHYEIVYGQKPDSLTNFVRTNGPDTSYTFTDLGPGTWYFSIRVVDQAGATSIYSDPVSADEPQLAK
jgi:hypothetical protein